MHISEASVKRPIAITMFFLGVLMIGLISLFKLAVDLLPDLSYPQLTIWTKYEDAAPEEVERFITKPVESSLQTVKGIKNISSVSQEGVSLVKVDFEWGSNMDFTTLFVREKLDAVRANFPRDDIKPVIIRVDPSAQPIMSLSVSGEDLIQLKESAEAIIKRRLEQIDGVALATVTGGLDREIHVDVDIQKMTALGVSFSNISSALRMANVSSPGGYIRKGRYRYSMRTLGEFETVEQLKDVVVGRQSQNNLIYLGDIALVKDSYKDRTNVTRFGGDESVGIIIQKEAGSNTVRVSEKVRDVIGQLKIEYPKFKIFVAYDQAGFISTSISNVLQAIVFGGILAFLVLFLFLHDVRNPIIISTAIPFSIIATFSLLYFTDVSLNIMSLGGLALGVGMLVDNSIVVLENIFRHRQEGKNIIDATIQGAREISMAVSASTFTTISVFFPIIFVEGIAGQLFRDQALTITFSLICSLLVSLTLLPMLASHFLLFKRKAAMQINNYVFKNGNGGPSLNGKAGKREPGKIRKVFIAILRPFNFIFIDILYKYVVYYAIWKGLVYFVIWKMVIYYVLWRFFAKLLIGTVLTLVLTLIRYWFTSSGIILKKITNPIFRTFDKYFQKFTDKYENLLARSLGNKGAVLIITVCLTIVTLGIGLTIDRELMPAVDQKQFEIEIFLPVGYTLDQTDEAALTITNWLNEIPSVDKVFSNIGIVEEKGLQSERRSSLNRGLISVVLKDKGETSKEVIQKIREKLDIIPDATVNFSSGEKTLQQVLGTEEADIIVNVRGEDFSKSKELMAVLIEKMNSIQGLTDIHSSFEEGKPEIKIEIDRDRVNSYGASVQNVTNFIANSMKGNVATDFKDFDSKINIVVRPEMAFRDELEDLLDHYYRQGDLYIPVRDLIKYQFTHGPNEIRREDQSRQIQVLANIHKREYKDIISDLSAAISEIEMPGRDYNIEIGGENREMKSSFNSLILALLVSIALVYMILAAQFESMIQPFVIIFAVPLSLIGVSVALFLTGHSLNVMSAIGIIILVGIVVNDAIVKVDFINQSRRAGMDVHTAVIEAGKKRLRPIVMTTVTTVFGLTPMAFGVGAGTGMQAPLAVAVIGGLISATFLTLIVIPVIYTILVPEKAVK